MPPILEQKLAVQQTEAQSTSPPIDAAGEVAANEAPRSEHNSQTEPEAHHADLGGDLVSDLYAGSNKDAVWNVRADPELMSWLDLEQIQAWLLMGHCDFIRNSSDVAILSATRISRLVQAARFNLQQVEGSTADGTYLLTANDALSAQEAIAEEEKGRAFWVAFCFDRMVNTLDHCDFMLQDESAYIPLPWPETAYQASEPTVVCTLTQALEEPLVEIGSYFAESIVAITFYGRCLTHRRLAANARAREKSVLPSMGNPGAKVGDSECQSRHAWLSQALKLRSRSGKQTAVGASTPLLALAHLMHLGCVVHLLETLVEHIDYPQQHVDQVYNAYDSVVNIAQFATTLPQAVCFERETATQPASTKSCNA
ncbi:hypothetical protein G7054_g586 [Neopestalotiopsis clavispora]|nr:hypothetical protein G7054_g586 [Neopestalotiopsis clavispora]